MDHQEARNRMEAYLRDCNEKERHDAEIIRDILAKHEIDSPNSNMSSHGMTKEDLEVLGRFLVNRTDVASFRKMAVEYLEWVSMLTKEDSG